MTIASVLAMTAREVDYGFLYAMFLARPFFLFVVILHKETQSKAVHVGNRSGKQQQPEAAAMPKDCGDSCHPFNCLCFLERTDERLLLSAEMNATREASSGLIAFAETIAVEILILSVFIVKI